MIVKPLSTEISVTSANTISDGKLIRLYAAADSVVTVANTSGPIGSFTLPAGSVTLVEKNKTDTIAGSTALLCTPISYKS